MNNFKEWLRDFKYLSKSNQIQIVIAGAVIVIGIIGGSIFLIKSLKDNKQQEFITNLSDYFAYSYQETGDLSVANLNNGEKILSKIKISNNSISKEDKNKIKDDYLNPYKIIDINDKLYVLNYDGEIVEISYSKDKLKELRRMQIGSKPVDFKIYNNNIYISYLDSEKIDVVDLNSGKKTRAFEASSSVTAFELAENMLYIGTKEGIEIVNTTNVLDKKIVNLDKEFSTTDILLSKDKEDFKESTIKSKDEKANDLKNSSKDDNKKSLKVNTLYALNNFANDNKNSVVMKVQEGMVVDILELKKENPISILEDDKYLYVACRGLENDKEKDSIIVINKKNFKIKKRINVENAPNYMSRLDEDIAFVSHDEGEIVRISLANATAEGVFKTFKAESSLIKRYIKK